MGGWLVFSGNPQLLPNRCSFSSRPAWSLEPAEPLVRLTTVLFSRPFYTVLLLPLSPNRNTFLVAPEDRSDLAQSSLLDVPNSALKLKSLALAGTAGRPAPPLWACPFPRPNQGSELGLPRPLVSCLAAAEMLFWPHAGRPAVPVDSAVVERPWARPALPGDTFHILSTPTVCSLQHPPQLSLARRPS